MRIQVNSKQISFAKGFAFCLAGAVLFVTCQSNSNNNLQNNACDSLLPDNRKEASAKSTNDDLFRRDSLLKEFDGQVKFTYTKIVRWETNSLELITHCINDTLLDKNVVSPLVTRPILERQQLIFKRNGVTNSEFDLPLKTTSQMTVSGNEVRALDVNIWRMYALHGGNGTLFAVDGSGLCSGNNCPEFTGLYSLDGEILFQSYSEEFDTVMFNKVLFKYGISDSTYRAGPSNGVRVDYFWH